MELEPKPQLFAYAGYVGTRDEMYRVCPFVKGLPEDMRAELEEEGAQNYERLITEDPQKANDLYEQTRQTIAELDEKQETSEIQPKQADETSEGIFGSSQKKEVEARQSESELPGNAIEFGNVQQSKDSQLTSPNVSIKPNESKVPAMPETEAIDTSISIAPEVVGESASHDAVHTFSAEKKPTNVSIQEAITLGDTSADTVQQVQLASEEFVGQLGIDTEHAELQEAINARFDTLLNELDEVPEFADELLERITEEFSEDDEADAELLALFVESNKLLRGLGIEEPTTERLLATAKSLALQAVEAPVELREDAPTDEESGESHEQEQESTPIVEMLDAAVLAYETEASPEEAEAVEKLYQELTQIAEFIAGIRAGQPAEQLVPELTTSERDGTDEAVELIEHPALQGITEEQLIGRLEVVCERLLDKLDIPHDAELIQLMVAELLKPQEANEQDFDISKLSAEEREKLGMRNFKYGLTFTQLNADLAALQAALHAKLGTAALKQSSLELAA